MFVGRNDVSLSSCSRFLLVRPPTCAYFFRRDVMGVFPGVCPFRIQTSAPLKIDEAMKMSAKIYLIWEEVQQGLPKMPNFIFQLLPPSLKKS